MSMSKEIEPRSSYNDHSGTLEISQEEQRIGSEIDKLFREKWIRPLAWNIKNGIVIIPRTRDGIEERIDGLENERISEELARAIVGFKRVEDLLPNFMKRGTEMTRRNIGLSRFNYRWGGEELQHSLALGAILEKTGCKTNKQITEENQENFKITIDLPYATARKVVAYSAFQERGTFLAYMALKEKAKAEDALQTARVLELIAGDEAYHCAGYIAIMGIYHKIDPEGTLEDVLDVAREFRMPAENLHPNRSQWVKDLIKVGVLRKGLVEEEILYRTLKGFGFIPEDVARKTADEFLKNRNPKYQTARDAR